MPRIVSAVNRLHRTGATLTAVALVCTVTVSSLTPRRAWASAPTDAIRDFFDAVNVVLADPRTDGQPMAKLRAIRRHVDEIVDVREAAMLALGREWWPRSTVERNEFVVHFADLLERAFVWRVAGKAALGGGVKVRYVGETVQGDTATVDTAVAARDGEDLRLQYRMVRRADRWVVRDVVMNGVSTMENYHAQFQRVVRDSSWGDLMSQLRAKLGVPAVHDAAATPPPLRSFAPASRERRARPALPGLTTATTAPAVALGTAGIARPSPVSDAGRGHPRALTAPVRTAPVERAPASGAYWIQVGAYRNPMLAGRVAERVEGEILIAPMRVAGDPLLRVRVGPFSSRAQARARLQQYRSLGYEPFVATD
jgi:phospholipid transport system substrate-binding protein